LACPAESGIEATLVADVHGGAAGGLETRELDGLLEAARNRLLAEGRDARGEAAADPLGVRRGGRGDDEAVEVGGEHLLRRVDDADPRTGVRDPQPGDDLL